MPKIIADECVHKDLFLAIRKANPGAISVKKAGLTGASDEEIFDFAAKTERALFTFDRGFGDIFRFNIAKSAGVIVLLIEDMNKDEMVEISLNFLNCLKKTKTKLTGKLAIVGKDKIRIIQR